jgi:tetratricopeptide (TPR) repeat protein
MRRALSYGLLFVVLTVTTGCVQQHRYPLNAFYQYDYETAVQGYRATVAQVKPDDRNFVLADVHMAGATFVAGDYYDSLESLGRASKIMDDVEHGADRGAASVVLAADMRVYKGEPYERALAYTYMGLIYFRRGDWDNARSAFNLALLADRTSKGDNEDYRDDFALAHYLIGRTYLKLGETDNAEISFNKVKKYMPDNPFTDPAKVAQSNVTFLIELGCGPGKIPDPVVGSVDMIKPCVYQERSAEVLVDGQSIGRAGRLVDMNYQAKTSGTSTRDTAQAVKGVAVAVMKQLPFVGILGSLLEMGGVNKADLRHWRQMPGEVHVLQANIPEGLHTVQINFFDEKGSPLERYRQVHYYFRVGDPVSAELKGEPLYVVRSGLDRHNTVRPKAADYLIWGQAGYFIQQGRGFDSAFGPDAGLPLQAEK